MQKYNDSSHIGLFCLSLKQNAICPEITFQEEITGTQADTDRATNTGTLLVGLGLVALVGTITN